jgi:phosphoglycolate phosphatase-like HAD superfamily hydrolase
MSIKTYAFDLDGTLCSLTGGNYDRAEPFLERIAHVNGLHKAGHKVIVFTARGTTSQRDLYEFTIQQLKSWGLMFDELVTGKPHFDILVDDKAVSETQYFKEVGLDD